MSAARHTPGPWSVFIRGKTIAVDIGPVAIGSNPCVVHWSGFDGCDLPISQRKANALLISAAPELLQMIIDLLDAFGDCDSEIENDARALVAKATGGAA